MYPIALVTKFPSNLIVAKEYPPTNLVESPPYIPNQNGGSPGPNFCVNMLQSSVPPNRPISPYFNRYTNGLQYPNVQYPNTCFAKPPITINGVESPVSQIPFSQYQPYYNSPVMQSLPPWMNVRPTNNYVPVMY